MLADLGVRGKGSIFFLHFGHEASKPEETLTANFTTTGKDDERKYSLHDILTTRPAYVVGSAVAARSKSR